MTTKTERLEMARQDATQSRGEASEARRQMVELGFNLTIRGLAFAHADIDMQVVAADGGPVRTDTPCVVVVRGVRLMRFDHLIEWLDIAPEVVAAARIECAQPAFSDCDNCGRADHAGYACPCGCHESAADHD